MKSFLLKLGASGNCPCLNFAKGQLISKVDWRTVDSPKKRTDEFDLFAVKSKKQTKQIHPFVFWENLWLANLLFGFISPLIKEIWYV